MYTLKNEISDFIVKEIPFDNLIKNEGDYSIFKLKKKDYNTVSAINSIANFLNLNPRFIGFAGNKDRNAITEQYISIKLIPKEKVLTYSSDKIELEYIGKSTSAISLGNLKGNSFEIIVRECIKEPIKITSFVNYFGEQRFSINNKEVGKSIIQKQFKKTIQLLIENGTDIDLIKFNKNDFVGCLQKIPIKTVSLYINAYQSYLWNKIVSKIIESSENIVISSQTLNINPKSELLINELPLIGFETEIEKSPYSKIIFETLNDEGINQRDFIIQQLGHLSASGNYRKIISSIRNLEITKISNSWDYLLKFDLDKGNYATVAIRQMF